MRFRFSLAFIFALAIPASAALSAPAPQNSSDTQKQIDKLFGELAKAGSPERAKSVEEKIVNLFEQSGSASVDLLMTHAVGAQHAGDDDTAKSIVITVTQIAPDYAEGWHVRAVLAQADNDDANALAYLQKVVTLNPRQFEAYAELAGILESYGDKKQALQYFRKAQALDPYFQGIDKHVQQLSRDVEGEKI